MGSTGLEGEFQYDGHVVALSTDTASSDHSSDPVYVSDASPNYMKATSTPASNANTGNLKKQLRPLTRRTSVKLAKGLTRMSSSKWRRLSMRNNSAGAEQRLKSKKLRSMKFATLESSRSFRRMTLRYHDPQSLANEVDESPNYLKATRSSSVRKAGSRASPGDSASTFSSKDESERVVSNPKLKSASSSSKALTRTPTLRPVRILTKMASLKTKRASRIHPEIPEIAETSIHRATCSSAIKDAKFNDQVEAQSGDDVSKKISSMKVCPYSYCSLHGHHRSTPPTLKRIKSAKKRVKSQGSKTLDGQSPCTGKKSSSLVRKIGAYEGISDGDSGEIEITNTSRKSSPIVPEMPVDVKLRQKADTNADASEHKANDAFIASFELPTDKQHKSVSFPTQEEVHTRPSCISESTEFSKIEKESKSIKCDNGGRFSSDENDAGVVALDLAEPADHNLDLENSLKKDDVTSTFHEEISQDVGIVGVETLELDSKQELSGSTPISGTVRDKDGSLADTRQISQESFCSSEEEPTSASKEAEETPKSLSGETEPNGPADDALKMPFGGRKYKGLWHLIYQHMVSDVAANGEALSPSAHSSEEEQAEDGKRLAEVDDKDSSGKFSERELDMIGADDDGVNQETELHQSDAIKLLQEAINKILLSKSSSHSSYCKSAAQDMPPKNELSQKNENEGLMESQSSTSMDEKRMETNADQNQYKIDNKPLMKDDTAAQPVNKSTQQRFNRWSNVKKIILQRRFIKALEKMRNFNPRIPRPASLEFASEGEKVSLRRRSIEDRKNSEDWMLDYALRQVVSKLDPEQKRKVALLVEAFESVAPRSGGEPQASPKVKYSPKINNAQASKINSKDFEDREIGSRNLSGNSLEEIPGDLSAQRSKPITEEQQSPLSYGVIKESSSDCCITEHSSQLTFEDIKGDQKVKELKASNLDEEMSDTINSSDQKNSADSSESPEARVLDLKQSASIDSPKSTTNVEVLADGQSQEVQIQNLDLQQDYTKAVSHVGNKETYSLAEEKDIGFDTLKNGSPEASLSHTYMETKSELEYTGEVESIKLEERNENKDVGNDKQEPENEAAEGPSPAEEGVTSADAGDEPQLENKRYTRLWFLIYKHMVSGLTAENGGKPHSEEEEEVSEKNKHIQGNEPASGIDDMDKNTDDDSVKLRRIEAIELVQDAIDQIPLPEAEDGSPKDQSPENKNSEQNLEEVTRFECGESVIPTQTAFNEDSCIGKVNECDRGSESNAHLESKGISSPKDGEAKSKEQDKTKDRPIKNWNKLKKEILLKRFVKALEKVRKISPGEPRFLPSEPNQEPEKVNLKHHDMDERKNVEEWMLDYALRQVVSRLTPERKRKVQLLVEAFETVIPAVGN